MGTSKNIDKAPNTTDITPDAEANRIKSDLGMEKMRLEAQKASLREQLIGVENQLFLIDRLENPDKYKPQAQAGDDVAPKELPEGYV